MNIFETAARTKVRFESSKGLVTVEDLFDAPLTSKGGYDLDSIAKLASRNLKEAGEESFVATAPNPARAALELKLEIVKSIIATKVSENAAKLDAAAKAQQKERLTGLLAEKQDEKLKGMTEEEIRAQIAALG